MFWKVGRERERERERERRERERGGGGGERKERDVQIKEIKKQIHERKIILLKKSK